MTTTLNIINKVEEEIKKQPRGVAGYVARDLVKDVEGFYIVEVGRNVSLFHKNDMLTLWLDLTDEEISVPHTSKIKRSGTKWAASEAGKSLGVFDDIMEAREACVLAQG
tara:strand:- start:262 stop:588 length:327 start_codon:yes stop_codon:yes gene_type:complete